MGLGFSNVILMVVRYGPACGNSYFLWREDKCPEQLTNRQLVIDSINSSLPKYFSRSHKIRVREATNLVMQDKISSSQFRILFSELTGDQAVADNTIAKNMDDRIKLLLKTVDESIIRDFRISNARKSRC